METPKFKLNLVSNTADLVNDLGISDERTEEIGKPLLEEFVKGREKPMRLLQLLDDYIQKCDSLEEVVYLTYILARKQGTVEGIELAMKEVESIVGIKS